MERQIRLQRTWHLSWVLMTMPPLAAWTPPTALRMLRGLLRPGALRRESELDAEGEPVGAEEIEAEVADVMTELRAVLQEEACVPQGGATYRSDWRIIFVDLGVIFC